MIAVTPAGELRHEVSLVQRNIGTARNEMGEKILQPNTLATAVRCRVRPLSAREIAANAENSLSVTHEVRLRYINGQSSLLTHADSLLFGSRTLDIASILNVREQNRELLLLCNERQP